jgi:mannose-6-phosphate isomerase-like protein (cupin superfamily)
VPYYVIDPKETEPTFNCPSIQRSISETAELNAKGLHLYKDVPSEQTSFIYQIHDEEGEVFYDLDGTASFKMPDRTYVIKSGEAFVVESGNPHRAFVPEAADGSVQLLAIGMPVIDIDHPYNLDSTPE